MLTAFLLGLTGSFGHCTGMCSGVALLLSRQRATSGWRLLMLHLGRITTYGLLGALAGGMGSFLAMNTHAILHHTHDAQELGGVATWQGALAFLTAGVALYLAVALIGRAPSPERYFMAITRWWGRAMRRMGAGQPSAPTGFTTISALYGAGLLWGLLPCGLVLTALVLATASGSASAGLLTLLAFGLGTWPVTVGLGWLARGSFALHLPTAWLRPSAALLMLAFSLQMTLRGLAAWGWVMHGQLGGLMLW